jgi:uncharacterized phiE125 gp8 family phage protein
MKEHLRYTANEDNDYIEALIGVARQYAENEQARAYMTQTWTLWLDRFPQERFIELGRPPLKTFTHLKYYEPDDSATTLSSDDYVVDDVSEPARIVLKADANWPSIELRVAKAVELKFDAGYSTAVEFAKYMGGTAQAIKMMVNHWHVNRVPMSIALEHIPETADALLMQGMYELVV